MTIVPELRQDIHSQRLISRRDLPSAPREDSANENPDDG